MPHAVVCYFKCKNAVALSRLEREVKTRQRRLLNMLLIILQKGEAMWFTKEEATKAVEEWKHKPWLETLAYLRWRGK